MAHTPFWSSWRRGALALVICGGWLSGAVAQEPAAGARLRELRIVNRGDGALIRQTFAGPLDGQAQEFLAASDDVASVLAGLRLQPPEHLVARAATAPSPPDAPQLAEPFRLDLADLPPAKAERTFAALVGRRVRVVTLDGGAQGVRGVIASIGDGKLTLEGGTTLPLPKVLALFPDGEPGRRPTLVSFRVETIDPPPAKQDLQVSFDTATSPWRIAYRGEVGGDDTQVRLHAMLENRTPYAWDGVNLILEDGPAAYAATAVRLGAFERGLAPVRLLSESDAKALSATRLVVEIMFEASPEIPPKGDQGAPRRYAVWSTPVELEPKLLDGPVRIRQTPHGELPAAGRIVESAQFEKLLPPGKSPKSVRRRIDLGEVADVRVHRSLAEEDPQDLRVVRGGLEFTRRQRITYKCQVPAGRQVEVVVRQGAHVLWKNDDDELRLSSDKSLEARRSSESRFDPARPDDATLELLGGYAESGREQPHERPLLKWVLKARDLRRELAKSQTDRATIRRTKSQLEEQLATVLALRPSEERDRRSTNLNARIAQADAQIDALQAKDLAHRDAYDALVAALPR